MIFLIVLIISIKSMKNGCFRDTIFHTFLINSRHSPSYFAFEGGVFTFSPFIITIPCTFCKLQSQNGNGNMFLSILLTIHNWQCGQSIFVLRHSIRTRIAKVKKILEKNKQ